ncbi:hypothetical protein DBR32_07495 [Taibaiella sp. KBW10]|uniref:hypothetical protein n=1 Tax=Taibaiella sp. KBW10 TaxID=2153357 RepID=UPI000F5A4C7F|nr:hypothetical protein [Taibaiella sp. KBW10]RQO31777.1 hypothetical protein DBR32_07495 [Taibaiella sp. KBW10]
MSFTEQDINNKDWNASNRLIVDAFEMESLPEITLADFLALLTQKVAYMLSHNTEELFSKLYRLDVLEHKIKEAFNTEDIPKQIATLIIERQFEKFETRRQFKKTTKPDEDLAW